MEIRWPCSSRLIRAAGLHYARHAVRSAFGLLQRGKGSPSEPHWPRSIPYTALRSSAVGLRTVGSHKTGTCLAQIFIGAGEQQVVIPGSAALSLQVGEDGHGRILVLLDDRLDSRPLLEGPSPLLPLLCPSAAPPPFVGVDTSITQPAPIVRIAS